MEYSVVMEVIVVVTDIVSAPLMTEQTNPKH